jgi:flagellar hook protein FlgE
MSFGTTLSGLSAFKEQLSTISNNISNLETTAYKYERVTFAEVLSGSMADSSGNGVAVKDVSSDWAQGTVTETGNSTDLAITGSGFFIARDASGLVYYTRDGEFEYDENKTLVTSGGMFVQGYAINSEGTLGSLGNIVLDSSIIPATPTSQMRVTLNLNSATETDGTFSSTINVYDSLGNEIPITITFTKSSTANQWTWAANTTSETAKAAGSSTLTFDSSGTLEAGSNPTITLALSNGATTPQTITWQLYGSNGNSDGHLTQYASDSAISDTSQNGAAAGSLTSISIDENGFITGSFSNGQSKELFQIALASFSNCGELNKARGNLYTETPSSGEAIMGAGGRAQFGTLTSGGLEMSNVDMTSELSNMILAQRAYQACAKMLTAESEVLDTTINMVR